MLDRPRFGHRIEPQRVFGDSVDQALRVFRVRVQPEGRTPERRRSGDVTDIETEVLELDHVAARRGGWRSHRFRAFLT